MERGSDLEIRMKEFSAEMLKSNNPLLVAGLSAYENCRPRELRILVRLAMFRAAVEYRLHGESGLRSVNDPCGQGPFAFRRFVFEGVDRGFELRSTYHSDGYPEVLIFVEKEGPAFRVDGPKAGQGFPDSRGRYGAGFGP